MGSNDGSPSDHAGVISEVASVIREFTEPNSEDADTDPEEKLDDGYVRSSYK